MEPVMTAIASIQKHVYERKNSKDPAVRPGQPKRFTEACVPGDTIPQGDLYLMIVDQVPVGYELVKRPKAADKQLFPGNTIGSRHCLDSLEGVLIYRPQNWNEESLLGPCLVLSQERTVLHPTHGNVTAPANTIVLCGYQPNFDYELMKERKARD